MSSLLQSTFISYGEPDMAFARRLYEALHANGVRTFFFPEHAVPGKKLHRMMREGVNQFDRVLLICSKNSLSRRGVLNEVEETLAREARDGGASYLIPILLDDWLFDSANSIEPSIEQAIRDRVASDFRDPTKFNSSLAKLIGALSRWALPRATQLRHRSVLVSGASRSLPALKCYRTRSCLLSRMPLVQRFVSPSEGGRSTRGLASGLPKRAQQREDLLRCLRPSS